MLASKMKNMTENGFEYVDLGLPSGTMWATCNVGASKPEDEGLLFQFGRVDGYKYGDNNNQFKTNDLTTASGKIYKENEILDLADDAAHVHMGCKWRMPTGRYNESGYGYGGDWGELLNNTSHNVVTINRVKGIMFTSYINGNQLFIPFMQGYWWNENWEDWNGFYGGVWSSQVYGSYDKCAYVFYHHSHNSAYVGCFYRSNAFSVRGVFKK